MTEEQERERDRVKKYRYTLFVLLLCISKCIGLTGIQRCKKTSIKNFVKMYQMFLFFLLVLYQARVGFQFIASNLPTIGQLDSRYTFG